MIRALHKDPNLRFASAADMQAALDAAARSLPPDAFQPPALGPDAPRSLPPPMDPRSIRISDYADREDQGILYVDQAGETLYRLEDER